MPDYNKRLLKEIAHMRYLNDIGVTSDRIVHCLEMLRFIRNTERGLDFAQGKVEEDDYIQNEYNENDYLKNNFPTPFSKKE